ncbi:MAG: hypothetical protein QOG59_947, partial [Solirubrobacteraceae bacterium]|nr:hypothetical protein [Solirubrobacteraceae bacterium]
MSPAGQEPGAVVVVQSRSGAPEPGLASAGGVTWAEGPLSIAAAPAAMRGLSVGPALVCLLEGVLYDYRGHGHPGDGPLPARSDSAASWLAAAYRRGGRGIFGGLRGDYWALVWDRERREGLVVCDQLGSRAPYWTFRDGIVHVASEVRDLLASLPRAPEPDRLALAHWLMMSVPPDGRTLYAGVSRLPAAHLMALGSEHPRPRRYWEPTYREPRHPSPETVRDEVRAALDVAVARRLARASAPGASAVLLSGGLDSSALAALSVKHVPAISTYSAVFPAHPAVDESAFIDATVTRLGVPNTRLLIEGGSVIEGAARFLDVWRSPPSSPNLFFWIPLLQRAADDGVSVLLDGEGGDEVFGFVPFLLADRLRQGRLLNAVRLASQWPGAQTRPPRRVIVQRLQRFGVRGALPPLTHRLMRAARPLGTYAPAWLPSELAQAWLETECS